MLCLYTLGITLLWLSWSYCHSSSTGCHFEYHTSGYMHQTIASHKSSFIANTVNGRTHQFPITMIGFKYHRVKALLMSRHVRVYIQSYWKVVLTFHISSNRCHSLPLIALILHVYTLRLNKVKWTNICPQMVYTIHRQSTCICMECMHVWLSWAGL